MKPERGSSSVRPLFTDVVVGVDGSQAGYEACCQAARLVGSEGRVELVCVIDVAETVHAGFSATRIADELAAEGTAALDAAVGLFPGAVSRKLVEGHAVAQLLAELESGGATLLVIGSHGHRRAEEIVLGGVAGELLHAAPCSVLVARSSAAPGLFPSSLVVGVDGSRASERALMVAEHLAARFRAPLRVVTALRGEAVGERPVEALVSAGAGADLVVVGSRGLQGLPSLGSVSERVAHRASCSVLVVRPQTS